MTEPNQEWAIDVASDVTAGGQRFRVFSVIDAFTRECLALETDTSMPSLSLRVTRVLQRVIEHLRWPRPGSRSVVKTLFRKAKQQSMPTHLLYE